VFVLITSLAYTGDVSRNRFEKSASDMKESSNRTQEMKLRVVEFLRLPDGATLPVDISWAEIDRFARNKQINEDDVRVCCDIDISIEDLHAEFAERETKRIAEIERHNHSSIEGVKSLEQQLEQWLTPELLQTLNAIATPEEAYASEKRKTAREAYLAMSLELDLLQRKTNLTDDQYSILHDKLRVLSRAIGVINRDTIDHTRS
jgi:hypothetical protein